MARGTTAETRASKESHSAFRVATIASDFSTTSKEGERSHISQWKKARLLILRLEEDAQDFESPCQMHDRQFKPKFLGGTPRPTASPKDAGQARISTGQRTRLQYEPKLGAGAQGHSPTEQLVDQGTQKVARLQNASQRAIVRNAPKAPGRDRG